MPTVPPQLVFHTRAPVLYQGAGLLLERRGLSAKVTIHWDECRFIGWMPVHRIRAGLSSWKRLFLSLIIWFDLKRKYNCVCFFRPLVYLCLSNFVFVFVFLLVPLFRHILRWFGDFVCFFTCLTLCHSPSLPYCLLLSSIAFRQSISIIEPRSNGYQRTNHLFVIGGFLLLPTKKKK